VDDLPDEESAQAEGEKRGLGIDLSTNAEEGKNILTWCETRGTA
jgi:hypothetical protein